MSTIVCCRVRSQVIVAGLALVAACDLQILDGLSFACEPTTIVMRGRVIDAVTNEPIAGARVAVAGQSATTTDVRGRFAVSVSKNTCEYRLAIDVSADGYASGSAWITWPYELTIALQPDEPPSLGASQTAAAAAAFVI